MVYLFLTHEVERLNKIRKSQELPHSDKGLTTKKEKNDMLVDIDNETIRRFLTESHERLDAAEIYLMALENDMKEKDTLLSLFRVFHTFKGDATLLEFEDMAILSHAAEDLLYLAREGSIVLSGSILDIVFESVEQLRRLLSVMEKTILNGQNISSDPSLTKLVDKIREETQTGL
jgi:two-component system chemotaxis sensor kinase CheA